MAQTCASLLEVFARYHTFRNLKKSLAEFFGKVIGMRKLPDFI